MAKCLVEIHKAYAIACPYEERISDHWSAIPKHATAALNLSDVVSEGQKEVHNWPVWDADDMCTVDRCEYKLPWEYLV